MEALGFTVQENPSVGFSMMCGSRFLQIGRARLFFVENAGRLEIEIEGILYDVPSELETIPEWDWQSGAPMPPNPKDEEEMLGFLSLNLRMGNLLVSVDGADLPRSEMSDVARRIGDIIRAIS